MMEIQIKEYSENDYSGIRVILYDNYNSEISKEYLEKYYISDFKKIYVATYLNDVVGCAFLEVKNDYVRPARYGYITYVAVAERFRKHGIGRKMIDFILDKAKESGCTAVELTSADFRTDAHRFYESLGFTKKKTTVFIKDSL